MSINVFVRTAHTEDAAIMAGIGQRAGESDTGVAAYMCAIKDPNRLVLVSEADGQLVGWAKTHVWDHADGPAQAGQYLGGVTVDPAWRRQGIAARLTQKRLDWIWARSQEAWYVVNAKNTASIELHRRWGFAPVAEGARFHTTTFAGDRGMLFRAERQIGFPNH